MPTIFSKLWIPVAASFGLQIAAGAIFVPLKNERYFDLIGTSGHIISAGISLYGPSLYRHLDSGHSLTTYKVPPLLSLSPRKLVVTAVFSLWAARLAWFLSRRIKAEGRDSRFDDIKQSPTRFFAAWFIQGAWVAIVGLPIWLNNAIPLRSIRPWGPMDAALLGLVVLSLGGEALADAQKSQWRKEKKEGKHTEKFIQRGLWSLSRHPNYVGEALFQTSVFALACRSLLAPSIPWQAPVLGALAPLFTYTLLRYMSGVPPLEEAAEKKWGDDPAWKRYKSTTPVFWPWMKVYD
ncbi:hypothetical protein FS842_004702 [Serendipita sp. 407]|nr:hypothetical protein FS842_004702 [Serendipita sp. 407]